MSQLVQFFKDRKNQRRYLKWLWEQTRESKKALIGLLLLNTFVAAASVLVSMVKKSIVDRAVDHTALAGMVILMVLMQLFSIFGGMIVSLWESVITEKYACQLRKSLFGHILRMPWLSRTAYHSEELLSRITSDVERITSGMSNLIISGGALLVQLILAFLLLWNYAPVLAIEMIVIAPVGALASMVIGRRLSRVQKEFQQTEADYRVFLQERLSKTDLVQIFGQEENSMDQLQKIQDQRLRLVKEKNKWKVFGSGIIGLTFTGAQMLTFVLGAVMVSKGSISFGMMTAFLSLVGQIQGPVFSLANKLPQMIGVLASAGRIMEISEQEEEHREQGSLETGGKTMNGSCDDLYGLRADSVSIGYGEKEIVKDLSFDVRPGQMVMLEGSSGIGKTTLLRTVMGFLKPSSGELYFYANGGVRADCGVDTRHRISYVPQGNTLMFGTIADNLRMGKPYATEEEMREALRQAEALDFVDSLPEGIDTVIGEKAAGISEGQAQRISIARALLKEAAILILDEATSSLDEKTEEKILNDISQSKHRTCLFVTHRKYLKRYADQVITLDACKAVKPDIIHSGL